MATKGTIKIKFVEDYEVQDEHAGGKDAEIYRKGAVRSMNETSAAHFVSRGRAVYVE